MAASCQNLARGLTSACPARERDSAPLGRSDAPVVTGRPKRGAPRLALLGALLPGLLFLARPAHAEGGTRGSNGLIPSLSVENVVAGEIATLTVDNVPPSSSSLRVLLAVSQNYRGLDVSAYHGAGAVVVPQVQFFPSGNSVVAPARRLPGSWPRRTVALPVPTDAAGATYWIQAFVEDPGAVGGWAFSHGFSVTVGAPGGGDPPAIEVLIDPDNVRAWAGTVATFSVRLRDDTGATVPVRRSSDIDFVLTSGNGRFYYPHVVGDHLVVLLDTSTVAEVSRFLAVERISGLGASAAGRVETVPGYPDGAIPLVAIPGTLPADGSSTALVNGGPVHDEYGNVVLDGRRVTVTTNRGTILAPDIDSGLPGIQLVTRAGLVSFQLRASSTPGTARITAATTEGDGTGTLDIEISNPGPSVASVVLTPPWADVQVGRTVAFTAEMRDASDQLVPATSLSDIGFLVSPGSGSFSGKQLVSGRILVNYQAVTTLEDARVVAREALTGQELADASWVYAQPGPPTGGLTVSASSLELPADGTSRTTITTSSLRDQYGNVASEGELVTITTPLGTVVEPDASSSHAGHQVGVQQGFITFQIQAPTSTGSSRVQIRSVRGSATGTIDLLFTELPDLDALTIRQAGTLPTPRSLAAVAYDPGTGVARVMGGTGDSLPLDVVEIDFRLPFGSQVRVTSDTLPQTRYGAPAVWDQSTGRAYAFGGRRNAIFASYDILVFDTGLPEGSRAFTLPGETLPMAVKEASAVWDPSSRTAWVFEGSSGDLKVLSFQPDRPEGQRLTVLADSLDGLWTRTSAAWDPSRGVAYVFGGSGGAVPRDTIVRFDPDAPAGSRLTVLGDRLPSARNNTAAVWDGGQGVALILGGSSTSGSIDQIVEFDPSRPSGARVSVVCQTPVVSSSSAAFFDEPSGRVFLVGGYGDSASGHSDSLLALDLATVRASVVNKLTEPLAYSAAAWSPPTQRAYVFGGRKRAVFLDLIHVVDPSLPPGDQLRLLVDRLPSPLITPAAAVSPSDGVVYLFGGQKSLTVSSDEIVRFDPSRPAGQRVSRLADRLPRTLYNSSAVWNNSAEVAYLFDTTSSSRSLKVFRFDPTAPAGSRLLELPDAAAGRLNSSAVWDPILRCAYLFGGSTASGPTAQIVRFDPARPAGSRFDTLPDTLPSGRTATSAVWDPTQGAACIFGGTDGRPLGEVLLFDPSASPGLRVTTIGDLLRPVSFTSAAYDATLRRSYIFGGLDAEGEYRTDVNALVQDPSP